MRVADVYDKRLAVHWAKNAHCMAPLSDVLVNEFIELENRPWTLRADTYPSDWRLWVRPEEVPLDPSLPTWGETMEIG